MEETISENFRIYLINNNPELALMNNQGYSLSKYIADKIEVIKPLMQKLLAEGHPEFLVSLICHSKLIEDLRPSKANYIREVLEAHFPEDNFKMIEYGVLTYGVVNLVELCTPLFQLHNFNEENQSDQFLKAEIILLVINYLKNPGLNN